MKSCLGNLLRTDYKVMGQERKELLEVLITSMIGLGIFKEDNQSRLISERVTGKEKSGSVQATQRALASDKSSRDGGKGN